MTQFKKATKKTGRRPGRAEDPQSERLSTLSESAQQIWLAGIGAFARAQAEGTKLFDALIKEGMSLEQSARGFAGGQAEAVRDMVGNSVGQARERAAGTWDRLEKAFEDRVQRTLVKLGVPGRDDLAGLGRRIDALTAELRRLDGASAALKKTAPRRALAKKSGTPQKTARKAARKSASPA